MIFLPIIPPLRSTNSPPLSLADAEGGEDDVEDALDIDLADDVAEGLEGFADFEGGEFGGFATFEGGLGGEEALGGTLEGGFVPGVDGDGMVGSERPGGGDDVADGSAQWLDASSCDAGDGDALCSRR